jgi:hypothetical protein
MEDFDHTVLEFIREYGFTAQYIKQADGEYDPATGTVSSVITQVPVEAILMDLTLNSNGLSTRFNTLVVAGDKQLIVRPPNKTDPAAPALSINTATDRVLVNGIEYKLVTFKEVNPTGADPVLFDLYIRR